MSNVTSGKCCSSVKALVAGLLTKKRLQKYRLVFINARVVSPPDPPSDDLRQMGKPGILALMGHQPKVRDRERQVGCMGDCHFDVATMGNFPGARQFPVPKAMRTNIRKKHIILLHKHMLGTSFSPGKPQDPQKKSEKNGKFSIQALDHIILDPNGICSVLNAWEVSFVDDAACERVVRAGMIGFPFWERVV